MMDPYLGVIGLLLYLEVHIHCNCAGKGSMYSDRPSPGRLTDELAI